MAKATSLLKAYLSESIPSRGGFIISAYFDPDSIYARYEITAYVNVKEILKNQDGLQFNTDGNRTHILVEPPTYPQKSVEPTFRDQDKSIPYRFNELHIYSGRKQEKIMIPKEPTMLHSYFSVTDTHGENFSFVFHPTEDVYVAMRKFIADTLYNDCNIEKNDALEASKLALETIKKFSIWKK
ncbi:MAG: hypothetical protein SVZ03_00385 [Spirochaetota bacterium]|nr:hypothetical protein [Spirochaetota bacterium]